MEYRFPFGQCVKESQPEMASKQKLFILGAYPSALHIVWQPPAPHRRISALAVDNEPEVFWDGCDQEKFIARWMDVVGFESSWGNIGAAGKLNGSSGRWVNENILIPFHATRADTFLTDCLNTYCSSIAGAGRISDTYTPFAANHALPTAHLPRHPNENEIVKEARDLHTARLTREIQAVQPAKIVTLGNAALRVLRHLLAPTSGPTPHQLSPDSVSYGKPFRINIGGVNGVEWWPLAHPAAPAAYQEVHQRWKTLLTEAAR
jgi:hypothetical protein